MSKTGLPYDLTLHVRDHCLCLHVRRAARALARRYDEALKPAGLTNGQFSLLMSLNRPEPPTMGQVAAVLDLDPTTLTANLKPLQRRGLVEIAADGKDKRNRRIGLTEVGREALAAALPLWRAAQADNEARVEGAAPDKFRQMLKTLS
ncbi:MAG: winged helix-turn-helix transcriptional regulator [Rhodomicrobium sp.]|nr:winged helix-turn-helix transcriptional regulator [Rhodomicrobium sp.]